jgi:hypothetical protein
MTLEDRISHLAGGIGLGGAGCLAAVYLGPTIAASGWTSVACATLLGGSAVGMLAGRYGRERRERLASRNPLILDRQSWLRPDGSSKPVDWLAFCLSMPHETQKEAIRGKLSDALNPLARQPVGRATPFLDFPQEAVAILALAFSAHYAFAENGRLARRILRELQEAHRLGASKAERLAALRGSLAPHLEPGGKVLECFGTMRSRHGMRESLLIAMLLAARKRRGVLASAEFLWLKGVDRGLWYALANAGRGTFLVEGLAAMDHYHHELVDGAPSRHPRIDNAVASLNGITDTLRERNQAA